MVARQDALVCSLRSGFSGVARNLWSCRILGDQKDARVRNSLGARRYSRHPHETGFCFRGAAGNCSKRGGRNARICFLIWRCKHSSSCSYSVESGKPGVVWARVYFADLVGAISNDRTRSPRRWNSTTRRIARRIVPGSFRALPLFCSYFPLLNPQNGCPSIRMKGTHIFRVVSENEDEMYVHDSDG